MLLMLLALLDGMPIRDGRFAGGPVTILSLDADQVRALEVDRDLRLTGAQRLALYRSAGATARTLWIYDTRIGENDCTCDAENLGLRFSGAQIEVPHAYLPDERPSIADWLAVSLAAALPLLVGAGRRILGA